MPSPKRSAATDSQKIDELIENYQKDKTKKPKQFNALILKICEIIKAQYTHGPQHFHFKVDLAFLQKKLAQLDSFNQASKKDWLAIDAAIRRGGYATTDYWNKDINPFLKSAINWDKNKSFQNIEKLINNEKSLPTKQVLSEVLHQLKTNSDSSVFAQGPAAAIEAAFQIFQKGGREKEFQQTMDKHSNALKKALPALNQGMDPKWLSKKQMAPAYTIAKSKSQKFKEMFSRDSAETTSKKRPGQKK